VSSIVTVPNALTFLRFLGIPIFIHLAINLEADGWAIVVLVIGGATDYFDGKLARAWNQTSRFGEIADPAIDRLYILAILIVFAIREILPLWMIVALIGRDLVLGLLSLAMARQSIPPFTVTYLGKAATFNLMYAFPLLLLAQSDGLWGDISFITGWSFAIWGFALYISTGVGYARQGLSQLRRSNVIDSR
jgi:cardiolipin synthase